MKSALVKTPYALPSRPCSITQTHSFYNTHGYPREAEKQFERCLSILREMGHQYHEKNVINVSFELARLYAVNGKLDVCEPCVTKCCE